MKDINFWFLLMNIILRQLTDKKSFSPRKRKWLQLNCFIFQLFTDAISITHISIMIKKSPLQKFKEDFLFIKITYFLNSNFLIVFSFAVGKSSQIGIVTFPVAAHSVPRRKELINPTFS